MDTLQTKNGAPGARTENSCGCGPETTAAAETNVRYRTVSPAVDVIERADEVVVRVDVPGANDDTIDLTVEREQIVLKADAIPPQLDGMTQLHSELFARRYQRRFAFDPRVIDRDGIRARAVDGVLEIVMPKRPATQPRKIAVTRV